MGARAAPQAHLVVLALQAPRGQVARLALLAARVHLVAQGPRGPHPPVALAAPAPHHLVAQDQEVEAAVPGVVAGEIQVLLL